MPNVNYLKLRRKQPIGGDYLITIFLAHILLLLQKNFARVILSQSFGFRGFSVTNKTLPFSSLFRINRQKLPGACNVVEKETPTQLLYCQFCKIFKNTYSLRKASFQYIVVVNHHIGYQHNN